MKINLVSGHHSQVTVHCYCTLLPSDVIYFTMLFAQRFWWETVSFIDVM